VTLGPLADIPDGTARNYVLALRAGRFHGFVLRRGSAVIGYVDRCPHMNVPLARTLDDYLTPDRSLIACSWHGALFAPATGLCVGGPCIGASLLPWPVHVAADRIVTGPPPQG